MATKVKTNSISAISLFDVARVSEMNRFDLTGEKSNCKGASNKFYRIEMHVAKDGSGKVELFTQYGPTGTVQCSEYRFFNTELEASKEYDRIVKSKLKKGYVEIDVAQRAIGSEEAKKITKAVALKNADCLPQPTKSNLHVETQRLIAGLMGSTNQFVLEMLKCPLGQLTNNQISIGRDILQKAKAIVGSGKKADDEILQLTNQFYGAIPHNLGSGYRGQMTELLLNDAQKILQKEYDLDTLEDAKSISVTLATGTNVDDQYRSLDCEFEYIDKASELFKWLCSMSETRGSNHSRGKVRLLNAWKVVRNGERTAFLSKVSSFVKESKPISLPSDLSGLIPKRPDLDSDCVNYKQTNTWPLFHGTRTQNITGIIKKGFLIRPSGAIYTGSMYGDAIYTSSQFFKSLNYSSISNSYWSKGNDRIGYLFVNDVLMGNPLLVSCSGNYNLNNIKPHHSVWAIGGMSGVINDEMMVYNTSQINQRYLLEFDMV
jgi:poly [ADP-ribose] polymerase